MNNSNGTSQQHSETNHKEVAKVAIIYNSYYETAIIQAIT